MQPAPPILPAHIEETIQAIAALHAEHHRRATPVQRFVDRSVRLVGRPRFVGLLTLFILGWIAANLALQVSGRALDRPPFQILQDIGEVLGLYITVLILITQRREDELAEHREQLTLELAILSEQKSAKIIQLLEELRRDNPMIPDRMDAEAEALSVPANPQAVLEAIKDSHEEMLASLDQSAGNSSENPG
ncbi:MULTISPECIES: DUF1003 domain-containing protein [unclassified Sphingomonas]|uniref:DUF1003 domain-containing protein n=1 Tax=unclassified Sphingomonas TaxID=196159 RepID=UPI00226AF11D|nr:MULTISPECIES: DUF1003 domain-containing protein [unclassified Sphingomonas]